MTLEEARKKFLGKLVTGACFNGRKKVIEVYYMPGGHVAYLGEGERVLLSKLKLVDEELEAAKEKFSGKTVLVDGLVTVGVPVVSDTYKISNVARGADGKVTAWIEGGGNFQIDRIRLVQKPEDDTITRLKEARKKFLGKRVTVPRRHITRKHRGYRVHAVTAHKIGKQSKGTIVVHLDNCSREYVTEVKLHPDYGDNMTAVEVREHQLEVERLANPLNTVADIYERATKRKTLIDFANLDAIRSLKNFVPAWVNPRRKKKSQLTADKANDNKGSVLIGVDFANAGAVDYSCVWPLLTGDKSVSDHFRDAFVYGTSVRKDRAYDDNEFCRVHVEGYFKNVPVTFEEVNAAEKEYRRLGGSYLEQNGWVENQYDQWSKLFDFESCEGYEMNDACKVQNEEDHEN